MSREKMMWIEWNREDGWRPLGFRLLSLLEAHPELGIGTRRDGGIVLVSPENEAALRTLYMIDFEVRHPDLVAGAFGSYYEH